MSFEVTFALIAARVCAIATTRLIASPPVTVRAVLRSWDTMDLLQPLGHSGGIHRTGRCIVPPLGEPAGIRGSCAGNALPRFTTRFTETNGNYLAKLIISLLFG